jgi:dethiobiotin synthase
VATVERLTGIAGVELVRLDDPLAPDTAARLRGTEVPTVAELGDHVASAAGSADMVYVEGAGGVLVRLDTEGGTLLGLGQRLAARSHEVEVVVVTTLALGTLNHTELTVQAVRTAGLVAAGLVLGDVPASPGLAERVNLDELPRVTGLPVIAAIPRGVGDWSRSEFVAGCVEWVDRTF